MSRSGYLPDQLYGPDAFASRPMYDMLKLDSIDHAKFY